MSKKRLVPPPEEIIKKARIDYFENNLLQKEIMEKYDLTIYEIVNFIGCKERGKGRIRKVNNTKEVFQENFQKLFMKSKKVFPKITVKKLQSLVFDYGISAIDKVIEKKLATN